MNSKLPVPTEAQEAETFVAYLRIKGYKHGHIPNETGHSAEAFRRAVRIKRQGGSKGFPDYVIIAKGQLVIIELKRQQGSATSVEQKEWIAAFQKIGVAAAICKGAAAAIAFIESLPTQI